MLTKFSHSERRALHRQKILNYKQKTYFHFKYCFLQSDFLLVMHRAYTPCENKFDAKTNAFLFLKMACTRQNQKRTIIHYAFACLLFSSSLCFSLTLRFFFSQRTFSRQYKQHFNVGCFHSLCFSILCHFSFCLCQPLKYLITNKSATVNFLWKTAVFLGKAIKSCLVSGLT